MKKLFLLLLIVSMSLSMTAERVEKHLALKVAETFMPNSEFVDLSKTIDYKNFYIFSTENSFVIVNKPDAIGENVDNEIKIYPNPTNGIVHVVCDNMKNITIMSLTGQVLVYEDVNDDDAVVDMSDLPQGVYIFRICKDDGSLIRKNVINNK